MKLSRKDQIPWGRNILLFFWWERSHYRHWQAQFEFATISADDLARSQRALGIQYATISVFLCCSHTVKINDLPILEESSITLQTSTSVHSTVWLQHQHPEMPSEFWPKSLLREWSKNSFFALKDLFRGGGVQWVGGAARCLWEVFWTAHGRGRTQSTAALKVKILVATLPRTANDALGHHLCNKTY